MHLAKVPLYANEAFISSSWLLRSLHTRPLNVVLRIRPLHLFVATGTGYVGYKQFEKHKEKNLEKLGVEVAPQIASEWERFDIH
ncbi:hypothetical protein E2320_012778 [Naja naja]|nr:hypothetical protein E2320_012778 [Naja naja]